MLAKLVEDSVVTILDEVKDKVDSTDFETIADACLNKLEGLFSEGGLADNVVELAVARIRRRFDIEDTNPDN